MSIARLTEISEQGQEDLTGFTATISSDHSYIHDGIGYNAIIETGSISSAYNIAFTTPSVASGKFIHFRPASISSSANYVDLQLTEGETYSGGTDVTPINLNRLSDNTTEMQAFVQGATATPSGTVLAKITLGTAGNPSSRSGGASGADLEIVFKQDTTYLVTLDPAGATLVSLTLFWYEEDGGLDS